MNITFDEYMATALSIVRNKIHSEGQSTHHFSDEALFSEIRHTAPSTALHIVEMAKQVKRLKENVG